MVLFMLLTRSLASCLSALSNILFPLVDLILLFNFKLLGVILWLKHLRVNLLWFLKSAIFFLSCSHFLNMATFSKPNSLLIESCRFLILFIFIYMTKGLHFLWIEPKFLLITSFHLVSTKASSGIMENVSLEKCIKYILENVFLYNLFDI